MILLCVHFAGLGIRASIFWAFFAQKWANERFAQKNDLLTIAHFLWATWANRSFLVSDLSNSLTSLTKKEKMSDLLIFSKTKSYIKHIKKVKKQDFRFFKPTYFERSAHFSWATWAIRSRSLISSEQPERFTHGRSFVLSDLSESLTVAHLIWAKWANEWMSNERMSEFPALAFYIQSFLLLVEIPC